MHVQNMSLIDKISVSKKLQDRVGSIRNLNSKVELSMDHGRT